jgi:hypothetical protein
VFKFSFLEYTFSKRSYCVLDYMVPELNKRDPEISVGLL